MDTRCKDRHRGSARGLCRCRPFERTPQRHRIPRDTLHRHLRKQFREHLQHGLPVFQHIGHARGRAGIVLQYKEFVGAGAHQINPDNMRVNPSRWIEADHFRKKGVILADKVFRQATGADDLLSVIDIVQESVDCLDPLLDAANQQGPLAGADNARHQIERDQPLVSFRFSINVEGDTGSPKEGLRIP